MPLVEGTVAPNLITLFPDRADATRALDCEHVDVAEWLRIYFKTNKSVGNGFYAVVVEIVASGSEKPWEESFEKSEARAVGYCTAYFDGIRHLYVGEDGKGYLFHPEMQDWIRVLEALHELEKRYCREWE